MLGQILLYTALSGVLSMVGGILLLGRAEWVRKFSAPFIAFAAGALLSLSFLDLLPEALELDADIEKIFIWTLSGFLIFFIFEQLILRVHTHYTADSPDHAHPTPILMMIGDAFHNFIDGVIIAATFIAEPALGVVTAVGVALHEVPQEIGDFSVLLYHGWKKTRILWVNLVISLLAIVGAVIGYSAREIIEPYLPQIIALTAGIFLYIAASDLIPEVNKKTNRLSIVFYLFLGIILVSYLGQLFGHTN